jgi:hypothetical protein
MLWIQGRGRIATTPQLRISDFRGHGAVKVLLSRLERVDKAENHEIWKRMHRWTNLFGNSIHGADPGQLS